VPSRKTLSHLSKPCSFQQATQLEALLRDRLGWDYRVQPLGRGEDGDAGTDAGDSDDEDRPVVVELTQEEARLAGLDV
jgi:hypothetical protein